MATQPALTRFVTVEEYLTTVYEPDCEYDDGEAVERNLGEFDHSFMQAMLTTIFTVNMDSWGVYGLPEQRVQIKARRFLIPDVCVLPIGYKREPILTRPPLIAIEIMSPEDRKKAVAAKSVEYLDFGVEHVWVIDPASRKAFLATRSGLQNVPSGILTVPGTPILVQASELFARLDRM
jgi:Uma2 family endonuclease